MIEVQTFNVAGDVTSNDSCRDESAVRRLARYAFTRNCGVSVDGRDCFSFAEVDRVIRTINVEMAA